MISGGPYGYEHINAAIQRRHPDSLLNWTERIIRMRKEVPEVGWGDFAILPSYDPAVLVMRYDWRNNSVLFVHNFDAKPHEIAFSVGLDGENAEYGMILINLFVRGSQSCGQGREAPGGDRSLWLPVVPGRRARLSPPASRHRSAGQVNEQAGSSLPRRFLFFRSQASIRPRAVARDVVRLHDTQRCQLVELGTQVELSGKASRGFGVLVRMSAWELTFQSNVFKHIVCGRFFMGRGLLLWLIGIPIPIILLIWLFGGLH